MKTFTKAFETSIAKLFFEDFVGNTDKNYYVFAAKTTPYESEATPPTIGKGVSSSFYDIQDQLVFGKRLTSSDIRYMIKKNVWSTGTVYDIYDDKDETLFDKNFFVFSNEGDQYSLFKCLNNNFGVASTDKPLRSRTSFDENLYQTGDGYIWKLLTTISATEFSKFETDDYAPLEHESLSPNYAIEGALDVILVEEEGSNYNTFAYGSIKSTAYGDDPLRLVIQTDTEKDIYEMTTVQSGEYPATNSNVYLWSFPITASNTEIFTALATADYSNTELIDADLLGTSYASSGATIQVARDLNFNLSYADFTGDTLFILTDGTSMLDTGAQARVAALASALAASSALFLVEILGRKLGDITNDGTVGVADSAALSAFFAGTLTDPLQIAYITNVMFPFMYANYSTYSDYLPFSFGLVTGLQIILVPELSANNSFYNGSSFYIRGGTGAGQLKAVTGYDIIGNDRVITVDSAFDTEVDATSRYEIAPRVIITGDGTGAKAISRSTLAGGQNGLSNGIRLVEVIDIGSGYSFANVSITANTGLIDSNGDTIATNSAIVRAIVSPPGGHGADLINETYASSIGLSVDFTTTDHPIDNDYHMFGLMSNPIFKTVTLSVDDPLTLAADDYVVQETTGARGYIAEIDGTDIILERVQGVWLVTYDIVLESGNVNVISVTGDTSKFDNRLRLDITTAILGQEFEQDELVTQEITGSTGYVHYHDTANNVLYLTDIKGNFDSGAGYAITGGTTGVVASINSITESDIYPDSGEILFIETVNAITRSASQSERVKIVTKF